MAKAANRGDVRRSPSRWRSGRVDSYIYWGSASGFSEADRQGIPALGASMDATADLGSIYDRGPDGTYQSGPVDLGAAHTGAHSFAQLQPPEYRADLVVELGVPRTDLAIMIEVQLGVDDEKRGSWSQYVAALWGRLRCPVWLLVVTVDAGVASWCAQLIALGGMQLRPVVIGPRDIPQVADPQAAREAPGTKPRRHKPRRR